MPVLADLEIGVHIFHEFWKSHVDILAENQTWTGKFRIPENMNVNLSDLM